MMIWFWHQIVFSSFSRKKFNTFIFPLIFYGFSKSHTVHQLKEITFKIIFCFSFFRSVFISTCGFSQAFWLNSSTLWIFLKLIHDLILALNFFMYITNSILSYKLATTFWIFLILIFTCNFSGYWASTSRKILYHFLGCCFLWNLH